MISISQTPTNIDFYGFRTSRYADTLFWGLQYPPFVQAFAVTLSRFVCEKFQNHRFPSIQNKLHRSKKSRPKVSENIQLHFPRLRNTTQLKNVHKQHFWDLTSINIFQNHLTSYELRWSARDGPCTSGGVVFADVEYWSRWAKSSCWSVIMY